MNVHFDNDVIHKLAACDLLTEAVHALDVTTASVLPTARYKFYLNKPDKGVKRYGELVYERISGFVADANPLDAELDASHLETLNGVLGIDQGEAILFASASQLPDEALLTGDKRSLIALAEAPSCGAICTELAGRVLCLEQIVQQVISVCGFEHVRARIAPSVACDTVLQIVFRDGLVTTEANATEGLRSYVGDLRGKTGRLLRA